MACIHCEKPIFARQMCRSHYQRWWRCGDPLDQRVFPGARLAYLQSLVGTSDPNCILWPYASKSKAGYGMLSAGNVRIYAHRTVCALAHGVPAEGRHAAHSCGNPTCVNPNHLRWATPKENAADKLGHGTQRAGSDVAVAKLTWVEVRAIRKLAAAGVMQKDLAARFGISKGTMSSIVNGKHWREAA